MFHFQRVGQVIGSVLVFMDYMHVCVCQKKGCSLVTVLELTVDFGATPVDSVVVAFHAVLSLLTKKCFLTGRVSSFLGKKSF